jgi:hypothetical protein
MNQLHYHSKSSTCFCSTVYHSIDPMLLTETSFSLKYHKTELKNRYCVFPRTNRNQSTRRCTQTPNLGVGGTGMQKPTPFGNLYIEHEVHALGSKKHVNIVFA